MRWLSRGGEDGLTNLVLLCPNHQPAIHRCDAPYDFAQSGFLFGETIEVLTDQRHILAA